MFVGEAVGRESAAMNDATAEQARSLERAVRSVYNLDPGLGY
jgi:hypothetical protein